MQKSILVVDDSATMRQMIRFALKNDGHQITEACDGQEAIDTLKANKFDLMITDLNMPKVDGLELTKMARSTRSSRFMPIILLTTESSTEKKVAAKSAGATGWITKPFTPEQLCSIINKVTR